VVATGLSGAALEADCGAAESEARSPPNPRWDRPVLPKPAAGAAGVDSGCGDAGAAGKGKLITEIVIYCFTSFPFEMPGG
jgi:hypothetical protein